MVIVFALALADHSSALAASTATVSPNLVIFLFLLLTYG
jgi:hypothetical protein